MKGYVAAVLRSAEGDFLMVHHKGIDKWVFPGGKPEDGEGFKDALIRELHEELSIDTAHSFVRYYGAQAHKVKGEDWVGVFFTVKHWQGFPTIPESEAEQLDDWMWMPLDDMRRTYDVPVLEYELAEAIVDLED